MNHKKYIDICNFETKFYTAFNPGDLIQITEKLDGSNAHLTYDKEKDVIQAGSRKLILTPENNLNGFYEFSQKLDKEAFKKYDGYYIFGEWNLHHLISYPPEMDGKLWCFDVWDSNNQVWMPQEFSKKMAQDCGLNYVPIFYEGPFISWEHVASFVGKSLSGATLGEGIVCKNQTTLNNPNSRTPFTIKLVHEKYKERSCEKIKKPIDPDELARIEYENNLVKTVVTPQRVEKCLYKLIHEDNIVPEDWGNAELGIIAKNLPRAVYNDCVKEAKDVVDQVENFGKICNKITMEIVKTLKK